MLTGGRHSDFAAAWAELAGPWRIALELAWQACASGTIGVGSVITDPDGGVVAQGRNSVWDGPRGEGLLRGTRLAHAEMNAFAEIPTQRSLTECTLWTTQQPCILCAAASVMVGIGTVRLLTADPFFAGCRAATGPQPLGCRGLAPIRRSVRGPALALAAMILHLNAAAARNPDGPVMALSRRVEPEAVSAIEPIVAGRVWRGIADAGGDAIAALGAVCPSILDAAARRARRLETANEPR